MHWEGQNWKLPCQRQDTVGTIFSNPYEVQNLAVACDRCGTEVQEGVAKCQAPTVRNPMAVKVREPCPQGGPKEQLSLATHQLPTHVWHSHYGKLVQEVAQIPGFLLVLSCQALYSGEHWKTCLLCWAVVCS